MERRGSDPKCQIGLLLFFAGTWSPTYFAGQSFFPILSLLLLPSGSRPHCRSPRESRLALSPAAPPSFSLSHYFYWPGLFVAQGHEEDIPPILQSLSLIEMGNKTTLQKKSLLWAALLEENESPKQIGFHDLRQTSLFILYNPV